AGYRERRSSGRHERTSRPGALLRLLVQCVIARPLAGIALESRCLPFSLADEMRGLLVRSSRTAARDPARGESADFVIAPIGSRASVLRRRGRARMWGAGRHKGG